MVTVIIDHNIQPTERVRVFSGIAWSPTNKDIESLSWEIRQQVHEKFTEKVEVSIFVGACQNKRGDYDNIEKTIMDAIVMAGVIKDDSQKYVRGEHIVRLTPSEKYTKIIID